MSEPSNQKQTVQTSAGHPEKICPPDTANQSTLTALSADRDLNQSSPITSPVTERVNAKPTAVADRTETVTNRIQLENKFNSVLKEKYEALLSVMKELSDCTEINDPRLRQLAGVNTGSTPDFDWKKLVEIAEDVFNDYSMKMQECTKEFDDLNKDFLIWQEASYIMDSEKVSKRLGGQEQWINSKENYLDYKKKELSKSAELIDNALNHLKK